MQQHLDSYRMTLPSGTPHLHTRHKQHKRTLSVYLEYNALMSMFFNTVVHLYVRSTSQFLC